MTALCRGFRGGGISKLAEVSRTIYAILDSELRFVYDPARLIIASSGGWRLGWALGDISIHSFGLIPRLRRRNSDGFFPGKRD